MPKKLNLVTTTDLVPPRPLGEAGQRLWDDVQRDYVINDPGGIELLALAAEALTRAEACRAQIEAEGLTLVAESGAARAHPLLSHELANRTLVSRLLIRLGLDVEPVKPMGRPGGNASGWTR